MSGVKKDMLLKVYSPKERGGSWAALGRLWAGFAGFLAVMCLLGLQGKGQLKMYVVPGGQIPRREQTVGRTTALQCCGGEHELFFRGFFPEQLLFSVAGVSTIAATQGFTQRS